MENNTEKFPILRIGKEDGNKIEEAVVAREFPLTIFLNNRELATLLCSPADLKYLTIGFLASEGLISGKDEIKKIILDEERGVARVETTEDKGFVQEVMAKRLITSGCGGGSSFYRTIDATTPKIESQTKMSSDAVFTLVNEFQHGSQLYLATHGVHSAALSDGKSILIFSEDVGRHNAVDKIFGKCLLEDIPTKDRVVITSGRVSSEILHKVAKRGIPIIISISSPTNLGVKIADALGITLIGAVRGKRMNVYTSDWRIMHNGK